MNKLFFAVGGYFLFGGSFFGAILGFFIGLGVDNYQRIMRGVGQGANQQRFSRGQNNFTAEDAYRYYQQRATTSSSGDFPTMLMALSAAVMKADGKVLKSELNYVKAFFNQQFGAQFTQRHLQVLKQFLGSNSIPLNRICDDIKMRTQGPVRVQLLHYLFGIAKADGDVSPSEINVIEQISRMLGVSQMDFVSVKNMFYRNIDSDFKVLGVDANATDDEVKKAYRKMAIKFHPDKVAQMGEEYQRGAKEKFQKIQEAYEAIKKRRGIK